MQHFINSLLKFISNFADEQSLILIECCFCYGNPGYNFTSTSPIIYYHAAKVAVIRHILQQFLTQHKMYWEWIPRNSQYFSFFHFYTFNSLASPSFSFSINAIMPSSILSSKKEAQSHLAIHNANYFSSYFAVTAYYKSQNYSLLLFQHSQKALTFSLGCPLYRVPEYGICTVTSQPMQTATDHGEDNGYSCTKGYSTQKLSSA